VSSFSSRFRLTLVSLAPVLIGVIAVGVDSRLRETHRLEMLEDRATAAAKIVEANLAKNVDALRFCAGSPHLLSAVDLEAFAEECGRQHAVTGGWAVLVELGETHRQIVNTRVQQGRELPAPYPRSEERETLLALETLSRADSAPAFSDAFFGRDMEAPVVAVGQFVRLADGRETMLYSSVDAAELSRELKAFVAASQDHWNGEGFVGLVDGSLRAVARSTDAQARVGTAAPPWFAALATAPSGHVDDVSGPLPGDPPLDIGFHRLELADGWVAFAGVWRPTIALYDVTMTSWPVGLALLAGLAAAGAQVFWRREERLKAQLMSSQAARDAAQAAEQERARIMAATAHEIRGPLIALLGALEFGRTENRPDLLAAAIRSGEGVLQLVTDLLEVSRLGARKAILHPTPTDVARAVCDVAARHRASAASKDVDLTVKTPIPPLPMMLVDRLRFEQIVENLVSNAVKFTPSGHVRIAVAAAAIDAGHVEMTLTVTDTGPGVPLAAREVIFEEFYRLEPTEREGPVGTGLGLPIARGLARAMGGDISVGSGTDGGAVFRVSLRLPVANDAACAECDRPLAGLSIVLAEDDPIILEITAHRLREAGAEVIEAADGAAAVAAVLGSRPDAAVLDLEMPILGGVGAVLRLRAHPALGGLRVFGLTAHLAGPKVADARAAGMDDVLTKPLQIEALAAILSRVAERHVVADEELAKPTREPTS